MSTSGENTSSKKGEAKPPSPHQTSQDETQQDDKAENHNKIKVMGQPEPNEKRGDVRGRTVRKLKTLVAQDVESKHNEDSDSDDYDVDGFKIPNGKIPLDGQFSPQEVEQLVVMSKEEGLLKHDVDVKVGKENAIASHIEVVEPHSE